MTIRDEINRVVSSEKISDIQFVRLNQWNWVLEKIAEKFLLQGKADLNHIWLWERFKEPCESSQPNDGIAELKLRLELDSKYWFIASDEDGKYWVMSGLGNSVVRLLSEMRCFEYYVVSEDLNSILCENHHGVFIRKGPRFS